MRTKRNLKMWLVMSVLLAGMAPAIAAGGTIYVDADASPGGDGQTWGTAYKYLQDALYKPPTSGDQIWVAAGTYHPDEDEAANVDPNDRTETFQLISGVALYGGFAGGESSLEERDWVTNETILSGDLNGDDVGFTNNGENSYHVLVGSGTEPNAVLDGFTITAGNANGSWPYYVGGGMFNSGGSPTVTNCTFSGNEASNAGGGMYNFESSPTVTNCTFSGNSAGGSGGGMATDAGSPTVTNCTFSGNSAGTGGGMANYTSSSPTVTNCTFSGNTAGTNGGGMYSGLGSPTVTNCTFSGNSAARNGGGMFTGGGSPTVTNCTFSGNRANWHGGGMWNENTISPPTVTNCTFSGNSAQYYGGGMFNQESNPTITNCILWGNTAHTAPEIQNSGQSPTVTYSDIAGGYTGTGNINADPLFADADLRLSAGSPCIDAGDNTAVPGGVTTDLDGNQRFVDDPGTTDTGNPPGADAIVDMGAYEYQPPIIFVDADAASGGDGTSWGKAYKYLRDALAYADSNPDVNEIWVAEGTYNPDTNTANPDGSGDREATFQLLNGVALHGGFPTGGGYWESRDTSAYPTILSGDLDGNDVQGLDPCGLLDEPTRGENSYHVLIGSGTDHNAVLDGFTITAGNANGTDTNSEGGGMRNYLGGPTVVNCTFSGNSAGDVGGGMDNDSGDAIVINCTFSRNSAMADGGGMCNDNYDFQDGSPTVTNCTFSENLARWGGGMSNYDDSKTVVSNCIFRNNLAVERGGAMDNDISTPTIVNCTFTGNSAGTDGGGMDNTESTPTVINCTFVGNSAINEGGGICDYNSSPTVTNCILWANTALSGAQIYDKGTSSATVSYSVVQGDWSGMGNIDEDPLFIDPNGLDGILGTADDEDDNVHLRGYSPCINAGDPSGDYSGQVDIDRQPRVAYGRVDMGADEVFPIAGDFEPDGDVDFGDFAIFAGNWLLGH